MSEMIDTKISMIKLLAKYLMTRCMRWVSFRRATSSPIFRVSKKGLGR